MIPNLYIENGCFIKHPFINGCLGFQEIAKNSHTPRKINIEPDKDGFGIWCSLSMGWFFFGAMLSFRGVFGWRYMFQTIMLGINFSFQEWNKSNCCKNTLLCYWTKHWAMTPSLWYHSKIHVFFFEGVESQIFPNRISIKYLSSAYVLTLQVAMRYYTRHIESLSSPSQPTANCQTTCRLLW